VDFRFGLFNGYWREITPSDVIQIALFKHKMDFPDDLYSATTRISDDYLNYLQTCYNMTTWNNPQTVLRFGNPNWNWLWPWKWPRTWNSPTTLKLTYDLEKEHDPETDLRPETDLQPWNWAMTLSLKLTHDLETGLETDPQNSGAVTDLGTDLGIDLWY